jgi:HK97 gp10 family phage protein
VSNIRVTGLQDLRQAMLQLPRRLDRRVLNAALMAGAREVVSDAQSRAPILRTPDPRRMPGTVRRNIRARPVRPTPGNTASVIIGVRQLSRQSIIAFKTQQFARGKRGRSTDNPNDPFYWRFLEFGTSKMAARPFLRPAFAARRIQALEVFRVRLSQRLMVEAQRLNRGLRR